MSDRLNLLVEDIQPHPGKCWITIHSGSDRSRILISVEEGLADSLLAIFRAAKAIGPVGVIEDRRRFKEEEESEKWGCVETFCDGVAPSCAIHGPFESVGDASSYVLRHHHKNTGSIEIGPWRQMQKRHEEILARI